MALPSLQLQRGRYVKRHPPSDCTSCAEKTSTAEEDFSAVETWGDRTNCAPAQSVVRRIAAPATVIDSLPLLTMAPLGIMLSE
jgi:hypothetical protein